MYIAAVGFEAKPGMSFELEEKVLQMREVMSSASGAEGLAWAGLLGTPPGSYLVTARFDSVAAYGKMATAVRESADYRKLSSEIGELLNAPALMVQNRILHAVNYTEVKPVLELNTGVMAAPFTASLGWGREMLDLGCEITGGGGFMSLTIGGDVSQVGISYGFGSLEEYDEAVAKRLADPRMLEHFDKGAGKFIDGAGQRIVAVKIA